MKIIQIVAIGIVGVFLSSALKKDSPQFSLIIGLITGILIILAVIDPILDVFTTLKNLAGTAGVESPYLTVVFKVIGIAYISEFGIQLCKDAGESSIAGKIELAGKILIMAVSAPVLLALTDLIMGLFG